VPIQTRCPSCSAAVPPTAAWCGLCHADLRTSPPPPSPTTLVLPARPSESPAVPAASDDEPVVGRHAAAVPVTSPAPRAAASGRHAARSAGLRDASPGAARTSSRAASPATLEGIAIPTDGELTPEQIDEVAEQMLARLAVSETRVDVFDLESIPGGKWGFAAGVTVALVLVFVLVSWLLVHLATR